MPSMDSGPTAPSPGRCVLLQQADSNMATPAGSDHADAAADNAALVALRQGFRISTWLGTDSGAPYRDGGGRILHARLDANSLRAACECGRRRYQKLTSDDSDLRALGVLDPRKRAPMRNEARRASLAGRRFWLLPPLMLLALLAFRPAGARGGSCCAFACHCPRTRRNNACGSGPTQQQHERIERGACLSQGDFSAAEKNFAGIQSADAFYNQGNAMAKQGRYDEASRLRPRRTRTAAVD